MNAHKLTVSHEDAGRRLVNILANRRSLSKGKAKELIDTRNVLVNGRRVWIAHHLLRRGDTIELLAPNLAASRPGEAAVLHEDEEYLVVNKPPGILSNADAASLEAVLRKQRKEPALRAVHRLDRDTSGCFLCARSSEAYARIVPLFRESKVGKAYHAMVAGKVRGEDQVLTGTIDGQRAVTKIRCLDANREASHLLVRIETGRTHQIRRHLAGIRHPILGDRQYAADFRAGTAPILPERQMLHASELVFPHPFSGTLVRVKSPLPPDFKACLRKLRLE